MNFKEDPRDFNYIEEEVKNWVSSVKKEIKIQSLQKGLIYNYDFSEDRPIKNAYSRLLWDVNPIISPKSIPVRASSASLARSSLSTAVALDYEMLDFNLPSLQTDCIEIAPAFAQEFRNSYQFCLRGRLGSMPGEVYYFKSYSRSKTY